VPLAHQSALAGVLLAVQLLTARHEPLRAALPAQTEGRLDLLATLAQTIIRPRLPTADCLCRDNDFQTLWRETWTPPAPSS
jgi:hypothetical protein